MTRATAAHDQPVARRRPGRPRTTDDDAIAAAILQAMIDQGFDAMTIDDIAARAGVGRATIYRRWPTKTAMVIDALNSGHFLTLEDPNTQDPRADLVRVLTAIQQTIEREHRAVVALQLEIVRHPELADAFRRDFIAQRQQVVVGVLARAVDVGLLPPDSDLDLLTKLGPALIWQHFAVLGNDPDPTLPARIATLIMPIQSPGAPHRPARPR